jgi:hypothetical protein
MKRIALTLVVLYALSEAFDSAVRWILDLAGAGAMIYLRDGGLLLASLLFCGLLVRERRDIVRTFWLLAGLALSACVSLCSGLGVLQTLFGLKVWAPFVCGFLLVETGAARELNVPKAWFALWLMLCAGIFLNYFYRYPWIGLTVDVGDLAISANREWNAMGVRRLSGFSRTSYDGAIIILLLYIYLVVVLKRSVTRIAVILVSGAAIALTTAKGAAAAFLATVLLLPVLTLVRTAAPRLKGLLIGGLIALAAVGAVVPLLSLQMPLPRLREGTPEAWLFASLMARAWDTWPRALGLVSQWQLVTGRGIGGIGAAQAIFEPGRFNPADNLFIYLYVTAGALGAMLYALCACASSRLQFDQPAHRAGFLVLISLFAYGLTVNIIESAVFALVLGGLLSMLTLHRTERALQKDPALSAGLARRTDPERRADPAQPSDPLVNAPRASAAAR